MKESMAFSMGDDKKVGIDDLIVFSTCCGDSAMYSLYKMDNGQIGHDQWDFCPSCLEPAEFTKDGVVENDIINEVKGRVLKHIKPFINSESAESYGFEYHNFNMVKVIDVWRSYKLGSDEYKHWCSNPHWTSSWLIMSNYSDKYGDVREFFIYDSEEDKLTVLIDDDFAREWDDEHYMLDRDDVVHICSADCNGEVVEND